MTIVEELIAEVREACAVGAEERGCSSTASLVRSNDGYGLTARVVRAGLAAIRKYFEDYEEVDVDERPSCFGDQPFFTNVNERDLTWSRSIKRTVSILTPKPTPEKVEVTRETLAVLAEHYDGTPHKDAAGNAALAEAKGVIG